MACTAVTDIVVRESGRYIASEIFNRVFGISPWPTLVRRGVYPGGLSEVLSVLMYERSAPLEANPGWTNVTVDDGAEGGACLPPAKKVSIGSTTRTFQLARYVVEGPDFCAEEFRTVFALRQQLDRIASVLSEYVRILWEIRFRHEYFRLVQRKVVVDDCANPTETNTGATTYPAACPNATLGLGLLEKYKILLLRDGAASSAMVRSNGAPVLTVIGSAETIGNIIRDNTDIREDIRHADSSRGNAARLLQGFGVNHTYAGFAFVIDQFPRRFTCAGGVYTEVAPFDEEAASKGNRSIIRSAYRTAPYEETVIFDPDVYHALVPQPIVAPHPNFRFDPIRYTGEWGVRNILDRTCNPDGNIIYHRGILADASMPVHPERGVAFVHLRCDPACGNQATCNS